MIKHDKTNLIGQNFGYSLVKHDNTNISGQSLGEITVQLGSSLFFPVAPTNIKPQGDQFG